MPYYHDTRQLPYSPSQVYGLVLDVARYPEFLPWCVGTRLYHKKDGQFDADMIIGFKMFRETISSRVSYSADTQVYVDYLKGPLKKLYNHWRFEPDGQGGCLVDFKVDFSFESRILEALIGEVFTKATERMIGAFESRAHALYGSS